MISLIKQPVLLVFIFLIWTGVSCVDSIQDKNIENTIKNSVSKNPPDLLLEPKFSSIKEKIFEHKCVSCHGTGITAEKVPLMKWDELLNSPRELVIPKNTEESGLLIAIERTDDKRMPPPSSDFPLKTEEITAIRDWILQGALEN